MLAFEEKTTISLEIHQGLNKVDVAEKYGISQIATQIIFSAVLL